MNVTMMKPAALTAVALAALMALGACGKKVDDTTTAPMAPAPASSPSDTPSPAATSPAMGAVTDSASVTGSATMGSGSTMPPPTAPASASTN